MANPQQDIAVLFSAFQIKYNVFSTPANVNIKTIPVGKFAYMFSIFVLLIAMQHRKSVVVWLSKIHMDQLQ